MRPLLCLALLCLAASAPAARWVEVRSKTLSKPADPLCLMQKTVAPADGSGAETELVLVLFQSASHTLRIVDNGSRTDRTLAAAMRDAACLAGVNGGYFHENRKPLGLVVSDGVLLHPRERSPLATGLLLARPGGLSLVRLEESAPDKLTRQGLQAGPFLVDNGQPVPGLNAARRARRTFVLTNGRGLWALGAAYSPTLADLGAILAQGLGGMPATRALNLDGGGSTGLWFYRGGTNDYYRAEVNPVRNYVGIVPR